MTKCQCGHVHCCHSKKVESEVRTTERGRPCVYIRESCADCNCWLSDRDFRFLDI